MKTLNVILGNHLFDYKYFKETSNDVFMCEDYELCTHFKYHKHKIIHFLSSMRDFKDYLITKNKNVHYIEFDKKKSFVESLKSYILAEKFKKIEIYEIEDKFFELKLLTLFNELEIEICVIQNPMFLCTREEFKNWLDPDVSPLMNNFYKKQRLKFSVLLDQSNKPLGGKWNYDSENRKKIPKKFEVESFIPAPLKSKNIDDVKAIVTSNFESHPGRVDNYWIPINRKSAIKWFKDYLDDRFVYFGRFQDAIDDRAPFLYHSLISPFLNIGFITPLEVIREIENRLDDSNLSDVEGFIRQVLGWREFVRGIYQNYSEHEESMNFFDHKRKLTRHWYDANTGVAPLDDVISKSNEWGYSHHIERLMITGNLMLMLQVDPVEVHKWFMEMYVDSSDWVMGPNVYGMSQFSDGGLFATKPYFSGSNYMLKMSNYSKGDWCEAVDGLYWQFIENNRSFFANNFRMAMMVKILDKMDGDKKKRIFKAADDLREKITTL